MPNSLLFVLGIQRSGTTWIANILDASPDTLLFMEPFAPAYGLFPELPESGFFLESAPSEATNLLRESMCRRIYRKKFLLSPRSLRHPGHFRFERGIARVATRLSRFVPFHVHRRVSQFTLLNLNRFEASCRLYPKSDTSSHWVVKELRFAGKIPLIKAAFPDARYLVVIRSPHATVYSILQWFAKGGLGEVKRELEVFVEKLEAQTVGSQYRDLIAVARGGGVAHRAALYWRVSYETLVRDLEGNPNYRLLPYESLARHPSETVKDLLDWACIPSSSTLTDYLEYSSSVDVKRPSATNTVRQSRTYYSSWEEKIAPEVRDAVNEMIDGSPLLEYLRPFYETGKTASLGPNLEAPVNSPAQG